MICFTLSEDNTGKDGEITRGTTGLKDQGICVDCVWGEKKVAFQFLFPVPLSAANICS